MKLLHVAIIYGRISDLELSKIESKVAKDNKLNINYKSSKEGSNKLKILS